MYLVRPPYLLKTLYPKAIWRMDKDKPLIYLTFDDGPVPGITEWVLDLLKAKALKATFFCVGDNVRKHASLYARIVAEGHQTGNHTFNHLNGWNSHTADYLQNIGQCRAEVGTTLFRPPYGKMKNSQYRRVQQQYTIVMWDVLSGDYDKDTSPEKCLANVVKHVRNGSVIVFHDSYKAQRNLQYALPLFIDWALRQGFSFGLLAQDLRKGI